MNYPEGSCWRRWDLHVHTPESMGTHYGAGGRDPWEAFLEELESLPEDIKVIGVNDYIFIDGYKRLRQEKEKGRLQNIDLLLAVVELRLDKFGGSDGHLRRVNYHVIFDDSIPPDVIESQFLNALARHYRISPTYAEVAREWHALPTKGAIEELGRLIIESVPKEKRHEFQEPLLEGFNNLNFTLEGVDEALRAHYFRDKCLRAIGKTEWQSIKWSDHSIAEKKNLINSAHLVFMSAENEEKLWSARDALSKAKVNSRLLDCSDAHYPSASSEKDRIGKCFTWIKADTTFRGLVHAYHEYEGRIYLGQEPPKVRQVRENPTKHIRSLEYSKEPLPALDENWFDGIALKFNTNLIAIIGNKGSGKSALADTIALLGDTKEEKSFSFLRSTRFREPRLNKALSFSASLEWESRARDMKRLSDSVDQEAVERVKYIPQHFLETLCNETPGGLETSFDQEVKKVIFSHVGKPERLGHATIDEVIADRTSSATSAINFLKGQLHDVNVIIAALEVRNTKEYRELTENHLKQKEAELEAHDKLKPVTIVRPDTDPAQKERVEAITREIVECESQIEALHAEIADKNAIRERCVRQSLNIDKLKGLIEVFQRQVGSLKNECAPLLDGLDIAFESMVEININTNALQKRKKNLEKAKMEVESLLNMENEEGPVYKSNKLAERIRNLEQQLDEPNKAYQRYTDALKRWKEKRSEILGEEGAAGTVKYYEKQLADLGTLTVTLAGHRNTRREIVREIYNEISSLAGCYRDLYEPVQKYIKDHPLAQEKVPLVFEVSIVNRKFEVGFLEKINQRMAGSFAGIEEGEGTVREMLARHEFNTVEGTVKFLSEVMNHLQSDDRPTKAGEERRVVDQLKAGFEVPDLYDFIFSLEYLEPRYILRWGDKELQQLSPGEKGSLLLIFYLIVDKSEIPLILDQPDENIDQETVYNLLVPCIKEAKNSRQVFIVTHNPNLAVVCDAEQFVYCSIDKAKKNRITYETGALESRELNIHASNVLEGTLPAFDNRNAKYIRPS